MNKINFEKDNQINILDISSSIRGKRGNMNKKYSTFMEATKVDRGLCKLITNEECTELAKAMCKDLRGETDRDNIIEEIVDVSICIEWIKKIHDISDKEIQDMWNYKTNRIIERLNNDKFK